RTVGWVSVGPVKTRAQRMRRLRPTFPVHEDCGEASYVHRVFSAQVEDLSAHALQQHFVFEVFEDVADPAGNLARLLDTEAAGGDRRRAETQAAGNEWRARVVRHGVLVHGDVRIAESGIGILTGDVLCDEA